LDEIALSSRDRVAILEAVGLLRRKFPVEQIILFGSKTRGDDDEESDIDLLVLTTHKITWRERRAITDALFDLQLAHDVVISTLVISASEWHEGVYLVLPIHEEIDRDGVAA